MDLLKLFLATIPVETIATTALGFIWPKGPRWIGPLAGATFELTKDLVEELTDDEYKDLSGAEKFAIVVSEVKEALDEGFDDIPEWSDLEEERRDRIIGGFAELALFIHRVSSTSKRARVDTTRALRKMKRQLKRA